MTRGRAFRATGALLVSLCTFIFGSLSPVWAATDNSSGTGAGNGMKVSPVHSELTLKPAESQTVDIYLTNVTGARTTFQAIVNDFVASGDESGDPAIILNPNQAAPSHGLKQYIAPIPNVTLDPGEQADVKAVVNMPNNVAPGGYYGAVRFAAVNAGAANNVSLSASVASLILVRVAGDTKEQLTIASLDARDGDKARSIFTKNTNISATVRFQNEGNIQEQPFGKLTVKNMHGKSLGTYEINTTTPPGNVLPGSIRRFSVSLKNIGKFGKYKIEGNFGYGTDGQLLSANTTFYVIPVPVIVGAIVLLALIIGAVFEVPRLMKRYNRRVCARPDEARSNVVANRWFGLARRQGRWRVVQLACLTAIAVAGCLTLSQPASAATIGSQKNPQAGSIGLEGAIPSPAPDQAATIAVPSNGQTINSIPTTVSGLCKTDLLVKIFSNNIFVGSTQCVNSSYSLQVNLFSGRNDLVARVYDALDQAGPDSNLVTVTYNDAQFAQFGTRVSLTSVYARLGVDPGKEIDWPIVLSGGLGPYAISIDWGDGKPATLMSVQFPGDITIKHVYDSAGIYNIIIKAVDANGTTAFLQLVGVANGKVGQGVSGSSSGAASGGTVTKTEVIWWPMLILLPLIILTFWLGRRHELFTLRRRLEHTRD